MSNDNEPNDADILYKKNTKLELDNSMYRRKIEKLEITIQELHTLTAALGLALSHLIIN